MSKHTDLEKAWSKDLSILAVKSGKAIVQIRKFFTNLTLSYPWEVFDTGIKLKFSEIGYGNDKSKMTQLKRVYFNEEEIKKANKKLRERLGSGNNREVQSCVTARMGAAEKDARGQGYCMQTITVSFFKNTHQNGRNTGDYCLHIDLNYRVTELTQKFLADLKFLHEVVIPALLDGIDIEPTQVNFYFSQAYFSIMYLPILYLFVNPAELVRDMEKSDPMFYRMSLGALGRLMEEKSTYNYRTRANMHSFFRKMVFPRLTKFEIKQIEARLKRRGDK